MDPREAVRRIRDLSSPLEPLATAVRPSLEALSGIRAVLFDVYGTLFVSASGEVGTLADGARSQALEASLSACRLSAVPGTAGRAAAALSAAIGSAHDRSRRQGVAFPEIEIREVFRQILRPLAESGLIRNPSEPDRPLIVDTALCERLSLEYECRTNPTWPMPGLRRVLRFLRGSGRMLGLISNAQFYTPFLFPAHLGAELEQLGIDEELCAWSYRLGEAKPSPSLFRPVLDRLEERGVPSAAVLFVGNDRRNDLWPAARLGCRTAMFAGDRRSFRPREDDPDLAGVRPDAVITALDQLPTVVSPSPNAGRA